jgi:large subunit ribosomal protein L22
MVAKATLRFNRTSARKVREVANLVRGKPIAVALPILQNISARPKEALVKLLNSAVANAKVKGISAEQLFISKLIVNEGPSWKRYRAASFGRASPIIKRTSHINIELDLLK